MVVAASARRAAAAKRDAIAKPRPPEIGAWERRFPPLRIVRHELPFFASSLRQKELRKLTLAAAPLAGIRMTTFMENPLGGKTVVDCCSFTDSVPAGQEGEKQDLMVSPRPGFWRFSGILRRTTAVDKQGEHFGRKGWCGWKKVFIRKQKQKTKTKSIRHSGQAKASRKLKVFVIPAKPWSRAAAEGASRNPMP